MFTKLNKNEPGPKYLAIALVLAMFLIVAISFIRTKFTEVETTPKNVDQTPIKAAPIPAKAKVSPLDQATFSPHDAPSASPTPKTVMLEPVGMSACAEEHTISCVFQAFDLYASADTKFCFPDGVCFAIGRQQIDPAEDLDPENGLTKEVIQAQPYLCVTTGGPQGTVEVRGPSAKDAVSRLILSCQAGSK